MCWGLNFLPSKVKGKKARVTYLIPNEKSVDIKEAMYLLDKNRLKATRKKVIMGRSLCTLARASISTSGLRAKKSWLKRTSSLEYLSLREMVPISLMEYK